MMAKNKTIENKNSVAGFVAAITDQKKRNDFSAIINMITKQTGFEPKMWGPSIVGFGSYHYKYESGREGDAPLAGIASRANGIVLYLGTDFENRVELLSKFGKHKVNGGCVYIKKLEEVDMTVLIEMVKYSVEYHKKKHAC